MIGQRWNSEEITLEECSKVVDSTKETEEQQLKRDG